MKASLFYLPSIGSRAEIEAGMAGMNPDFYQRMLRDSASRSSWATELGYDSVSFTEHHFHIEGFGSPTTRCCSTSASRCRPSASASATRHRAAGVNPIRVAEDIAMLDHMTGGR